MKSINKDFKYYIQFNLEERKKDFNYIMMKCSNNILVIIEKDPTSKFKEKKKIFLKISEYIRNKLEIIKRMQFI